MTRVPRWLILAAELAVAAVVVFFAWRSLQAQWSDVARLGLSLRPEWGRLLLATAIVLATYVILVEVWRETVRAWGEQLPFGDAARIWFVSSLARYVPGKLWQVGAMALMARRAGISPVAASGAAIIGTIVNLFAGFCVALVTGARALETRFGGALWLAAIVLVGAMAVTPWVLRWAVQVMRRDEAAMPPPQLPRRAVTLAFVGSVAAWMLYGVAFQLFSASVLGRTTGTLSDYITVYTASYLVGFLVLFAPGGVGFREMTMIPLMQSLGIATAPEALIVAVTSRLWLTAVELVPGLLMLAVRRPERSRPPLTHVD